MAVAGGENKKKITESQLTSFLLLAVVFQSGFLAYNYKNLTAAND